MKQRDKIVLGVVLAVVVGGAVWLLTCSKCALPPAAPPVEAPKEPLPEDIVGERMADTNYVAALKGLIDERSAVIAEVQTVRHQMEELLAAAKVAGASSSGENVAGASSSRAEKIAGASSSDAEKVAGASSSDAEKIAGASSSDADDAQPNRELEAPATLGELEAPPTMPEAPASVLATNTALQAGTVLESAVTPPAADLGGVPPALLAHVRQQPEWGELEARLNALAARQQEIQIETQTLIRERMEVQYAARAAENPEPVTRPPARVIKPMTNAPDFDQTATIVITNVPPGGVNLPPLPDRRPIQP